MRTLKHLILSLAVLVAWGGLCLAAVPLNIPVQGVLRDNAGVPVVEDVFEMTFALYESADAPEPVWTEVWAPEADGTCADTPEACVHVQAGLFRVSLGAHEPLNLDLLKAAPGLWLGVAVETDPELPRRPLGSAPYALHAQDAASASALDCSGCIALDMLGPGVAGHIVEEALQDVTALGYVTADGAVEAVEAAGFAKQADLVVGEDNLPGNGLNEVSNGLLSNEFIHNFASAEPVDIKDDFPPGVFSTIQVADVGTVQTLKVAVDITNSDLPSIIVTLYDPNGEEYVLLQSSAPGDHLVATYPSPDPTLTGDLTLWNGQNPAGEWILKVVDDGFKDNGLDGQIVAWSIEVDTLSNQAVAVDGDLVVDGTISGPGGIVVGTGDAPCDAEHAGALRFDPVSQRLTLCTGTELLQLKACSTQCKTAEAVVCGEPITDGCDAPCEGTGTALNTTQCLVLASSAPCGQDVTDVCGNDCGLEGSSADPTTCPDPATVACSVGVLDPCGNDCGAVGTGLNDAICGAPEVTACGLITTDPCGNDCGEVGTQCANKAICEDGSCQAYGDAVTNPGLSCKEILDSRPSAPDGAYWIDPDGEGGGGAFEVFCDMTVDGGGWTLVTKWVHDHDHGLHNPGSTLGSCAYEDAYTDFAGECAIGNAYTVMGSPAEVRYVMQDAGASRGDFDYDYKKAAGPFIDTTNFLPDGGLVKLKDACGSAQGTQPTTDSCSLCGTWCTDKESPSAPGNWDVRACDARKDANCQRWCGGCHRQATSMLLVR